jgi:hypothetical protein
VLRRGQRAAGATPAGRPGTGAEAIAGRRPEIHWLGAEEVSMRRLRALSICCLTATALACGGIGLAYERRLVDDLGLAAVDTREQMAVVEFTPKGNNVLVSQSVFAVGWDKSHVVAKRHPPGSSGKADKAVTQFFIVEVRDRKVHGPLDEPGYRARRRALGVAEGVDFTLRFDDLE